MASYPQLKRCPVLEGGRGSTSCALKACSCRWTPRQRWWREDLGPRAARMACTRFTLTFSGEMGSGGGLCSGRLQRRGDAGRRHSPRNPLGSTISA